MLLLLLSLLLFLSRLIQVAERNFVIVVVVRLCIIYYIAQVVPRAWLNSLTSTCSSLGLLLHCDGDDVIHFIMYMMVMMSVMMMMMMMMFMRCAAPPLLNSPWHRPRSASRRIQLVHTLSQVGKGENNRK